MGGRLSGRVVIVTGGGHGIGRAYCHALAREGARLAVAEIDGAAGEAVAAALRVEGADALAVVTDVADEASTHAMATATLDRFGRIINISSGTVFSGSPTRIHYVASKAAVVGFTRTLAREVGAHGTTVNAIAPGSTLSEEHVTEEVLRLRQGAIQGRAIPRVETPEDLLGAVIFFASDESAFGTGQTLVVDGGNVLH